MATTRTPAPARSTARPTRTTFDAPAGQVPRGRPHGQRLRRARGRRQPARAPRVARPRRRRLRGRRRLARLPALARRPRPRRRPPGEQCRASRPRRGVAASLPGGACSAAARTRCATCYPRRRARRLRRVHRATIFVSPAADIVESSTAGARPGRDALSPKLLRCSTRRRPTCSPSRRFRKSTGGSCGATTRTSGRDAEIRLRAEVVGIFPAGPRSSASSAPSSPTSTTRGPSRRRRR